MKKADAEKLKKDAQELLKQALEEMWPKDPKEPRQKTLARIAQHRRCFENWWKCELATHLWDHVEKFDSKAQVWIEVHDKCDIAIGTPKTETKTKQVFDVNGPVCIPLELKTVFTSWQGGAKKAFTGSKKSLASDLKDLKKNRRKSNPIAAVALIITHVGNKNDKQLKQFIECAEGLDKKNELNLILNCEIPLPPKGSNGAEVNVCAHQMLWTK